MPTSTHLWQVILVVMVLLLGTTEEEKVSLYKKIYVYFSLQNGLCTATNCANKGQAMVLLFDWVYVFAENEKITFNFHKFIYRIYSYSFHLHLLI